MSLINYYVGGGGGGGGMMVNSKICDVASDEVSCDDITGYELILNISTTTSTSSQPVPGPVLCILTTIFTTDNPTICLNIKHTQDAILLLYLTNVPTV